MVRKAFIGLSGPIGYDYRHATKPTDRRDYSSPNPVLENVSGLLICYDELLFLSRQFCPDDLRDQPYVSFLSDHPRQILKAETVYDQFTTELKDYDWRSSFEFGRLRSIIERMTGDRRDEFAIDNHTHAIFLNGSEREWHASSATLDNLVLDIGIASTLDDPSIDVIMNTPAVEAVRAGESFISGGSSYQDWKISAASHLVTLRTPNVLGPRGSYAPVLDELRSHPHVDEFRDYLAQADEVTNDGTRLANEIAERANRNISLMAKRYLKGRSKYYSIGSVVLGGVANLLVPGSGILTTAPLGIAEMLQHRRARKDLAWSSFVFDASSSEL